MSTKTEFASKIGLIAAYTVGSAIGLGNIWRFPCRNPGKRRRGFPPCLYTLRSMPRHTCDACRIFAWPRRTLRLLRRFPHARPESRGGSWGVGAILAAYPDHGVLYGCCRLDSRISLPKRFGRIIRRYRQCRRLAERVVQHAYGRLYIHRQYLR